MKVRHLLLISLLIVGVLCIPAVSAEEYNFVLDDSSYNEQTSLHTGSSESYIQQYDICYLYILNANEIYGNELVSLISQTPSLRFDNYNNLPQSAWTKRFKSPTRTRTDCAAWPMWAICFREMRRAAISSYPEPGPMRASAGSKFSRWISRYPHRRLRQRKPAARKRAATGKPL